MHKRECGFWFCPVSHNFAGLTYIQRVNHRKNIFKRTESLSGTLISGFQEELLLSKDAKILQSYSIDYGKGGKQYTTEFTLKYDIGVADLKYQRYLKDNRYYISNNFVDDKNPLPVCMAVYKLI